MLHPSQCAAGRETVPEQLDALGRLLARLDLNWDEWCACRRGGDGLRARLQKMAAENAQDLVWLIASLTWKQVTALATWSREGKVRSAARELLRPHSAVSQMLSRVKKRLDVFTHIYP